MAKQINNNLNAAPTTPPTSHHTTTSVVDWNELNRALEWLRENEPAAEDCVLPPPAVDLKDDDESTISTWSRSTDVDSSDESHSDRGSDSDSENGSWRGDEEEIDAWLERWYEFADGDAEEQADSDAGAEAGWLFGQIMAAPQLSTLPQDVNDADTQMAGQFINPAVLMKTDAYMETYGQNDLATDPVAEHTSLAPKDMLWQESSDGQFLPVRPVSHDNNDEASDETTVTQMMAQRELVAAQCQVGALRQCQLKLARGICEARDVLERQSQENSELVRKMVDDLLVFDAQREELERAQKRVRQLERDGIGHQE
ncbi:hypothetical protein BJY01DRAFT_242789 [Aspergillus pseudoustus]|uniref:Uncharacterized protein n=1 Tax=Aspergillus pseudoustus TaxID=1810923 RepID=A0ABR4KYZ7_9EURO